MLAFFIGKENGNIKVFLKIYALLSTKFVLAVLYYAIPVNGVSLSLFKM